MRNNQTFDNPSKKKPEDRKFIYGYNNNTNYGGLANATPEQMGSFKQAMHSKYQSDLEAYRGKKMNSNQAGQYQNMLNQKSKSFNNIGNLRFKLSQITDPGDSRRMLLQQQLRDEVGSYNQARKQTWNPGYGRGMGLLSANGVYGGVSFNKF